MEARFSREGRLVRRGAFFAYLSFQKESKCFLLRTFLSKKKSGKFPIFTVGNLEISENSKGVTSLPPLGGKVKVTQCFVGAVLVNVRVSRYGNLLANELSLEFIAQVAISPVGFGKSLHLCEARFVCVYRSSLRITHRALFANRAIVGVVVPLTTFRQRGGCETFGFAEFLGLEDQEFVTPVGIGYDVFDGNYGARHQLGAGLEPTRGKRIGNGWIHFRK